MYEAKHSIKAEGNKKATLVLGPDDFPFPIPLVNTRTGWEFDTAEGRIEVLYRRIGRNELDAIQTSLAFVDAENEYADKDRGEGAGVYAQRIVSSAGKKDGLFWRDDNDPSPLGALAAQASAEGYKAEEGPAPYHGYYFRILKGQGSNTPGGALNYVVKGKMIGGFALVAWPAEYGNSGVMTFLVNHIGTRVIEPDEPISFFMQQLSTTRNLGSSRRHDFVFGGVNNHIEHHLFPSMPTARLRAARPIVREFCRRHELVYRETSWLAAARDVIRHFDAVSAFVPR